MKFHTLATWLVGAALITAGTVAHADRLDDIKKAGVLRVATFDSNPPFGYVDGKSNHIVGLDVDYVATDWGTVGARRASKEPPEKGGWNIFHTWHAGVDCVNPGAQPAYYTTGDKAWFGWPKSDEVQARIDAWFAASSEGEEKAAVRELNKAEMDFATFLPTGFFRGYQAWRKTLSGVVQAPFPVVWGVKKA